MRLIDADALIDNIPQADFNNDKKISKCGAIADMVLLVCDAPTIETLPVVRGEWVEAKSGVMSVWPPGQVMCSVCGQRMPSQWKKMPPYCYGCGAKMEGGWEA